MAQPVTEARAGAAPEWTRRYPPLVVLLVAMFIALAILPSALNVPQSNPTETLEYAPVPPEDDEEPPPPVGNFSSLALAGSSTIESGGAPGGEGEGGLPPPEQVLNNLTKNKSTKRCVGNPPRQTEDMSSPPCVAHFEGDNFGATYQGVTRDEVRVLFYVQGFYIYINTCRDPAQRTPDRQYFDLAQPPSAGEHCVIRVLRTWQTYFNERYQTYNRLVHFYVYFSGSGDSAEERRADAADNFNRVKPFAVISLAESFNDEYLDSMAQKRVLNFGSFLGREAEFFQRFPRLIWGYRPSLEIMAEMFTNYICTKVAPHRASFVGSVNRPGTIANGQTRKYGLWYTNDPGHPELVRYAELVRAGARDRCGVEFAATHRFPSSGYVRDNRYPPTYAQNAVADFQQKNVTTIIWPAGLETNLSKMAAAASYRPEFVVFGDRNLENDSAAGNQEQTAWHNARVISPMVTYQTRPEEENCYIAYRDTDPTGDRSDILFNACPLYDDIRQLFIGIQVAGPRLGPTSIDKGFRAIPKIPSGDPKVPACFYEPGDYTCVKDVLVERWDSSADNNSGCYRVVNGGLRVLRDRYPAGDVLAQDKPDDPCNAFTDSVSSNNNPPG